MPARVKTLLLPCLGFCRPCVRSTTCKHPPPVAPFCANVSYTRQDEDFFERVSVNFDVFKTPEGSRVEPTRIREVAMCLRGDWYMLTAKDGTFPVDDPVKSLDVQVCA